MLEISAYNQFSTWNSLSFMGRQKAQKNADWSGMQSDGKSYLTGEG